MQRRTMSHNNRFPPARHHFQKTRCRQSTLDSFLVRKKKKPTKDDASSVLLSHIGLFGSLPRFIWTQNLLPFLSVNGLTRFSHSCRWIRVEISQLRGPYPHILHQAVLEPKLVYSGVGIAKKRQTFQFWIRPSPLERILLINMSLSARLWGETNWDSAQVYDDATSLIIEVEIQRAILYANKSVGLQERVLEFWRDGEGNYYCYYRALNDFLGRKEGFTVYEEDEGEEAFAFDTALNRRKDIPVNVYENLKCLLRCYWICVKRATEMEPILCPNLHHILYYRLPEELQPWLPSEYRIDPEMLKPENIISPEGLAQHFRYWKYRKPSSKSQYRSVLEGEFKIYEIPWFKDWYPKPILLKRSNLFASLPASLIQCTILPFLSENESTILQSIAGAREKADRENEAKKGS